MILSSLWTLVTFMFWVLFGEVISVRIYKPETDLTVSVHRSMSAYKPDVWRWISGEAAPITAAVIQSIASVQLLLLFFITEASVSIVQEKLTRLVLSRFVILLSAGLPGSTRAPPSTRSTWWTPEEASGSWEPASPKTWGGPGQPADSVSDWFWLSLQTGQRG